MSLPSCYRRYIGTIHFHPVLHSHAKYWKLPTPFPKAVYKNAGTWCVSSTPLPTFWRSSLRVLCLLPIPSGWLDYWSPSWLLRSACHLWGHICGMCRGIWNARCAGEHRTVGGVCSQPSGGVHAQTDMLDSRVCVWAGWLVGSVGGLADRVHRPAGRACEMVVKIPVPIAVSPVPFLCSLLPPNYLVMLVASVFWVRGDRSGLIRQCPERLGKLHTQLSLSLSCRRNHNLRRSLLCWVVWLVGQMIQVKWNCTFYPFLCNCSQILCSTGVLEPFYSTPELSYRYWLLNQCLHQGMRTEASYPAILLTDVYISSSNNRQRLINNLSVL